MLLSLSVAIAPAQNRAAKWYYANGAGLDFMTNPPTVITGSMNAQNSCASISDAAGNLLFYTNGSTIWNQQHQVMSGGSGLNGNSRQAVLIVPQPGSSTIYYVFTCDGINGGLYYSTVDMTQASGLGAVTSLNTTLISNNTIVGKVAGTAHCNGDDVWVLAESGSLPSRSFYSFLVTASGVSTTPVVSPGCSVSAGSNVGQMHFSPRGTKLGMVSGLQANYSPLTPVAGNMFHLWDFDPATGVVSNSLALGISYWTNPILIGGGGSGCEFSPDGSKFYGGVPRYSNLNNQDQSAVLQWDLCAGSATAIAASEYTANTASYNGIAPFDQGDLQLAPNGKIYVMRENMTALDVIGNPNTASAGCNYQLMAQATGTLVFGFGLPNFLSSYLQPTFSITPFTQTVSCLTASFSAPPVPTLACAVVGPSVGLVWNFGEPASGAANTSTNANPVHSYASPGTYTVQLSFVAGCATRSIAIPVSISPAALSFNSSSITCSALGSATAVPQGGIGPFSYSWMPGGQSGPIASGLIPGTYSVAFSDQGFGCAYTATINFPPLVPLSGQVNNSPSIPCAGVGSGTAAISLYGSSGNSYYYWTNGLTVQTGSTASNLAGGLHTVTVVDALTSCSVIQSFFINQPPLFSLLQASSSPSACAGASIGLSVVGSGGTPAAGYTYTWTNGSNAANIAVSEQVPGAYNYTVIGIDGNGCSAVSSISVAFVPNPTVSVADASVCPTQWGTLTATGATSYSWQPFGMYTATLTDNPATSSAYTVTGETAGCLSAPVSASIVILTPPTAGISGINPVCQGQPISFTATAGNAFAWSGPAAFSATVQSPSIAQASLNSAGLYSLILTAANGCSTQATWNQTVIPTPTLALQGSTVCAGSTLSLSANAAANSTYSWSGPGAFTSTQQNPLLANAVTSTSGNYSLLLTSAQGCTTDAMVNAVVVPPPSLSVALSSPSMCAQALSGSPNTITLTSSGADTYSLYTPSHIANPNPAGPTSPVSLSPPYQSSGPATATLMGSNGVCTVSLTADFMVVPNPSVSLGTATPVICAGNSYTYTSSGAQSYTWSGSNPGVFTYTSGDVAVVQPSVNAVFSVIGTSLGCLSALQSSSITVNPLPILAVRPASVCLGQAVPLVAVGNAQSYSWWPATGLSAVSGTTVLASPPNDQQYQVTASLNGCTVSISVAVEVLPLPQPSIQPSFMDLCLNERLTLSGAGGRTYSWTCPGHVAVTGSLLDLRLNNQAQAGMYTLTVSDANGCRNSSTAQVVLKAIPQAAVLGPRNGCAPFCTRLSIAAAPQVKGSWLPGAQTPILTSCFEQAGNYTFRAALLDTLSGCSNTVAVDVEIYPTAAADFEMYPEQPVEGLDEVRFTAIGTENVQWQWQLISNNGPHGSDQVMHYLFETAGSYPVALVVHNAWGCSDTVVKRVTIHPDPGFYVPSAFTPNEDGKNEIFRPVGHAVENYQLWIFDRWGQQVFESNTTTPGWDGYYKGEPAQSGVYAWKILLQKTDGVVREIAGHVTLYR